MSSAFLAGTDGKRFKEFGEVTSRANDTPFIKELIAEGLKPGTQEFSDALKAKRQDSPFVIVPGVGVFAKKDILAASEGGSVTPSIPQDAIAFLKQNPNLRAAFDVKYGKGASAQVLGGS
jgi:hypothetical protein